MNYNGEEDRQAFSTLNGHSKLNSYRPRFDSPVSTLCSLCPSLCKEDEDINQYLYKCEAYELERDILESTVQDALSREALQNIGDINLKVMFWAIEIISKQGQNELIRARMNYIRNLKRFRLFLF